MSYKLNRVADNEPMADDQFYKWLDQFDKRALPKYTIVEYLKSLGFIVGSDELSANDHAFLKHVLDHWYDSTPEYKVPCKFGELFSEPGISYIRGKSGKYAITKKLHNIVMNSGWIYNCDTTTTYFELMSDGRLFAKYQSILGGRFLCRVILEA